jgi:hypothetical protein
MNDKPNLIVDLTFNFSLKIIAFTEQLEATRKFNMANQLFLKWDIRWGECK